MLSNSNSKRKLTLERPRLRREVLDLECVAVPEHGEGWPYADWALYAVPGKQAYLSPAVDSFLGYFVVLGPNSSVGVGTGNVIKEAEGDYIVKCIRKLQKEDYATMTVKPERVQN